MKVALVESTFFIIISHDSFLNTQTLTNYHFFFGFHKIHLHILRPYDLLNSIRGPFSSVWPHNYANIYEHVDP